MWRRDCLPSGRPSQRFRLLFNYHHLRPQISFTLLLRNYIDELTPENDLLDDNITQRNFALYLFWTGLVNSRKIFCCWFTMSNSRLGMIYTPGPSRTELIWSTGLHDRASQICSTAHQMGNCRPSYIIMSGACSSQLTNKCYPPVVVTKDMIWGSWYTRKRGLHIGEW